MLSPGAENHLGSTGIGESPLTFMLPSIKQAVLEKTTTGNIQIGLPPGPREDVGGRRIGSL